MSILTVTGTKIINGIWQGIVSSESTEVPKLAVHNLDKPVANVQLTEDHEQGHWLLQVPIPAEAITEGVQTFVITDAKDGTKLAHFHLIAGEVLGDDIRAEIDLLRAELDMLKRAFRRHCVETT
ncbi:MULTISPECIES: hypothetical protein [Roseobacteraceae]|jgi:hypothetical protein|uniref:Uncharacterized protein n=1 Tax=Pseudosulfitobacter pseudonitzschiae TaxID=1402135 RepID=A0A221K556_9RHOB|nr:MULTISPECIES: hypothetical protein [Roseobacteraceae]ASM74095.1 hypothetical protein SULPSESMR1_03319 [Pseudosulfitobacter pseudonitzschiae]